MFARIFIKICILVTFMFTLTDCASSQSTVSTVEHAASCPAAGTRVPYAQILAQTRSFVGCDIETEVSFVGAGMGGLVGNSIGRPGESVFRATPPGQGPSSGGPLSTDFSFFTVADASAGPLFTAAAGQRFVLRGAVEMQTYSGGYDPGNLGRIIRATTVTPAP